MVFKGEKHYSRFNTLDCEYTCTCLQLSTLLRLVYVDVRIENRKPGESGELLAQFGVHYQLRA